MTTTTICLSDHEVLATTQPIKPNMTAALPVKRGKSIYHEILLKPLIKIKIIYHGNEQEYQVPYDTVGNTLLRLHIDLKENDVLPFDTDEYIFPSQTISIPRIDSQIVEQNEIIKYDTKILSSDDLLDGETKIEQKGQDGLKSVTYKVEYFNGNLWHRLPISETVSKPSKDEIIKVGTQTIIEQKNADAKSKNSVLLKTKFDDQDFSLPNVKLSANDRDLLERLLTGEFGSSFTGAALVAQAIKCAIVYDKYTSIESLIHGMGYVGSTDMGKTQNAIEAAKFIFDENGLAVQHRLFYMCTADYYESAPGNFHSTQNFILQYENVKFFDRW